MDCFIFMLIRLVFEISDKLVFKEVGVLIIFQMYDIKIGFEIFQYDCLDNYRSDEESVVIG